MLHPGAAVAVTGQPNGTSTAGTVWEVPWDPQRRSRNRSAPLGPAGRVNRLFELEIAVLR